MSRVQQHPIRRTALIVLIFLLSVLPLSARMLYTTQHYSVENGLSQNTVNYIYQDRAGFMWFGTWDGLNKFDGVNFTVYRPQAEMGGNNNRIVTIWEDSLGRVCAYTYEMRCFVVEGNELVPSSMTPPATQRSIKDSLYIDQHGIIWTVDDSPGISRYRDGKWKRFTPKQDKRYAGHLRRNFIVFEDNENHLWVNPTGGGFSRYNYETDELEWPFEGMTNMIHTAFMDRQGLLWVSTYDKGVDCINPSPEPFDLVEIEQGRGEVRAFLDNGSSGMKYLQKKDNIYCAVNTSYGVLLGNKGQGVLTLNAYHKHSRDVLTNAINENLPNKDVYCIAEHNSSLYIGTFGDGVYVYPDNKLLGGKTKVRELMFINDTLLAATTSGLLVGDTLLPYYDIRCLLHTKDGRVWVGSFGSGLGELIRGKDLHIQDVEYGPNIALAMAEDNSGNIWFTDEKDIYRYHPATNEMLTYDVLNYQQNSYFTEAKALAIKKGINETELYFGYSDGYCRFNPDEIKQSTYVPSVVISDVNFISRKDVTISYSALDFFNPGKIQFESRLLGYQNEFVNMGHRHFTTYTNLKPGLYTFEVRSTNSEGVWMDNVSRYSFDIKPTFWQSGWSVLLYLIVGCILIYLSYYSITTNDRLKQEVEVEQKVTNIKLQFFTNISHELRTPLTLITGPVDNMLKTEKLPSTVRSQLEIVSNNGHRMLRLVNQLLDFRKVQNNQMKLKVQLTNLNKLAGETCNNFVKEALDKHITFTQNFPQEPTMIWLDQDKLDIVLYNLLSNAFKYTPNKGTIDVSIVEKDTYVQLSVSDTGVGIPKDKMGMLFERFISHNEVNSPTRQPGTGIGLSLSKELVKLHKGFIEVESEVGAGSTFTVLLRKGRDHFDKNTEIIVDDTTSKAAPSEVEKSYESLNQMAKNKKRMLVVDDNLDMQAFLTSIFADTFEIETANDGIEALKKIGDAIPDIVITDLMMPNMDGLDLTKNIRESQQLRQTPVIILTAKTSIEDRLAGLERGADDYVTKPFSPDYIRARVMSLIQQRDRLFDSFREQIIKMDPQKGTESPDEIFMAKLMNYMEDQMENNALMVDDLVNHMAMGRTVFFNRLKAITGLSPVEFIREVRIRRSAQLLEMGTYNITEIAYMVGLNDSRYFSKCFKQQYGMTPTEYKRMKGIE